MSFMKPFCNIMSLAILLFFSGIGYTAVNIIPLPTSLTVSGGSFTLPATVIIYADDSSVATVPWLEELFKQAGLQTQIGDETSAHITIKKITNPDLGSEGYSLKITDKTIAIQAQTLTGQFYAVQSIRQLMPPEIELRDSSKVQKPIVLDQLDIVDVPRFAVRGSMLDVVRHFLPMSYLRNHVDRMALFKLNRFHIHLTDDQGWRLEIPGYDKLVSIGAQTQVGGAHPLAGERWYFTQSEMKEFIQYCADRKITIIPEIDMPGHSAAAIASYLQLSATGNTNSVSTSIGNTDDYLKGGDDFTKTFITDVLTSVAALFPGEYIHIGGDECFSTSIADYATFIRWVEQIVKSLGKKMVGWEEIAQDYLGKPVMQEPTSRSQRWYTTGEAEIISWCKQLYFDHKNKTSDPDFYSLDWCITAVPLYTVYRVDLSAVGPTCVGLEAPYWTEVCCDTKFDLDLAVGDRHIWPRLVAMAEVTWSKDNSDACWADFLGRLAPYGTRFDLMGIPFYRTEGACQWQSGPVSPKPTSVFDDFKPQQVPIIYVPTPKINKTQNIQLNEKYTVFDMQGRIIGVYTGKSLLNTRNITQKIVKGVYFIVNTKGHKAGKITLVK